MVRLAMFNRFLREACPRIFFLLFILTVLVSPLLSALPAYADWGADTRLTFDPAESDEPFVVGTENILHLVWSDHRDGNWAVYYKNAITAWGADTRLSTGTADSMHANVVCSGNNVHVAWSDHRDGNWAIYYKRSIDNGTTWGDDTRLSTGSEDSIYSIIVVSGNNVHIIWNDLRDGPCEVYYKRSTDGGTTWGADTRLSTGPANSYNPTIAVSGNSVRVIWTDTRDGNLEIYYKCSVDNGTTWGADTWLTSAPGESNVPVIAVSGNSVHVTWKIERDGNYEIHYKRSVDGGANWGADTWLTNAPGEYGVPILTVLGNSVHIVWDDSRDGHNAIYCKHSYDGGTTWGTDTRLSTGTANSLFPIGNNLFVIWHDNRDGNYEIYYKIYTGVPAVSTINPNQGTVGHTLDNVIINGANFTPVSRVSFGDGIIVNKFRAISDTKISVNITITRSAVSGVRNVSVTTPLGTATGTAAFRVVEQSVSTTPHGSSAATPASSAPPVSLTNLQIQSACLSASTVTPGMPVTVTADIANKSTINGSKKVTLYVNGEVESTQGVTVDSGGSSQLTFSVLRNEPGEYKVYVDGAPAGSFKVELFKESDVILIFSTALLVIAFVTGIIMLRRRQQGGN